MKWFDVDPDAPRCGVALLCDRCRKTGIAVAAECCPYCGYKTLWFWCASNPCPVEGAEMGCARVGHA